MKRPFAVLLAVASFLGALAAQAVGQNAYPPVYDATGARLTAVAPQPPHRPLPLVYDATGALPRAMNAPVAAVIGQDAAMQGIAGYIIAHDALDGDTILPRAYDATGAMQAAMGSPAPAVMGQDAATQGIAGYVNAHDVVGGHPVIPRVYDATGAMQAAVVESSAADAAVVTPSATAGPRTEPSTYLVIGLGLLAAAALIGAWTLTHRPATRGHRPHHV